MVGPVGGAGSSHYQPESKPESEKTQNTDKLIMEVEDILQRKFHHGQISEKEFITLSKRLDGIQKQAKGNEAKEAKVNEQTIKALNQLKNEIQNLGPQGGSGETSEGSQK